MILDARSVTPGTVLETEVCIIGAGAAGITLAREFIGAPFRVTLLESGGMDYEPETSDLYAGTSIGRPFEDLTACRLRYFGGTTNHWGGWCLPLDPIDFEPRDDLPYHGWPFGRSHLDPWYRRAQEICQLGPFDYQPSSWGIPPTKIPRPFSGPIFSCKLLQENWLRFGPVYAPDLRKAPRVTAYLHANAFNLRADSAGTEVSELLVKALSGTHFSIRARIYVLAAGGIENARLLLASENEGGNGLGNAHDLVGRFLMVHLVYSGGMIVPADPHMNFDFQTRDKYDRFENQRLIVPAIGLSPASMHRLHLPNIIMMWYYKFAPVLDAVQALKRLTQSEGEGEGPGGSTLADLGKVISNLESVTDFVVRRALFDQGIPIEALMLGCTLEQQPNPQSRVTLGSKRDALGMREIVVDWQWTAADKNGAAAILRLLGEEIGRAGFGRLRASMQADGPWPDDFYGNEHHIGTTRMHRDPTLGVVDENCRVHGSANLYVAGSSVFPSGGANNPTLTIVALAVRLADHIKERLS